MVPLQLRLNMTVKWLGWYVPQMLVLALWWVSAANARSGDRPVAELSKFEQQVAPILARHCLECHTTSLREGGLDLSQRVAAMAGGESGPAITPSNLEQSLLWEHVASDTMPQDRPPLSKDEKTSLKEWIQAGAEWTIDTLDPFAFSSSSRAGYDWWSLQPVQKPTLPTVRMNSWVQNDIDYFVVERLEAAGLQPAIAADRRTLIRRLYFDLIGLPPEPEAVERFMADSAPDAYEKLVSELLDSPHYGERWARHWLDAIRFGESQGFERNRIRENAWRYRDWVIQSFNSDLPYDEFVRQQIAGDVLYPGDLDALLATGYHVSGTWDQVAHLDGSSLMKSAAQQDYLEDLVATLGQAFIGLTVNCARCHDHKFDPISQLDYFSMAALLGGVTQQENERRDIQASRDRQRQLQLEVASKDLRQQLDRLQAEARARFTASSRGEASIPTGASAAQPIEGLLVHLDIPTGDAVELKNAGELKNLLATGIPLELFANERIPWITSAPPQELTKALQRQGEFTLELWMTPAQLEQSGPARIVTLSKDSGERNFTLGQEGDRLDFRLRTTKTNSNGVPSLATPSVVSSDKMHVVITWDTQGMLRIFVNAELVAERKYEGDLSSWNTSFQLAIGNEVSGDRPWQGRVHRLVFYSQALEISQIAHNYKNRSLQLEGVEPWESVLASRPADEQQAYETLTQRLAEIQAELEQLRFDGVAHVVIPQQPPIYKVLMRGDINQPGEVVVPRGLAAIAQSAGLQDDFGLTADAPEASRREALARWLSDPKHPLTARVIVNRVWHYHFGQGIVDTPSDFGYSGGLPSHPELLDYLAATFVEQGWSLKRLHRLIVTSATYRQSSQVDNAAAHAMDADNRLLWRFNSRQLEGEAVRDAALAVSGALVRSVGGPSYRDVNVNMNQNHEFTDPTNDFSPASCRRTIYRLWARSGNHPLLQSLDCPDPSVMMPNRPGTITPIQALSMMNNAFVEKCAERFAARVTEAVGEESVSHSIQLAYRLAFGREPMQAEMKVATDFIQIHGYSVGLEQLCLVLLNTNEFIFVD